MVDGQMRKNLRVGDPLGYPFFRGEKYENKRVYFFINEDAGKALVVAYGRKKDQQRMTKELKSDKEKYMDLIS